MPNDIRKPVRPQEALSALQLLARWITQHPGGSHQRHLADCISELAHQCNYDVQHSLTKRTPTNVP